MEKQHPGSSAYLLYNVKQGGEVVADLVGAVSIGELQAIDKHPKGERYGGHSD